MCPAFGIKSILEPGIAARTSLTSTTAQLQIPASRISAIILVDVSVDVGSHPGTSTLPPLGPLIMLMRNPMPILHGGVIGVVDVDSELLELLLDWLLDSPLLLWLLELLLL